MIKPNACLMCLLLMSAGVLITNKTSAQAANSANESAVDSIITIKPLTKINTGYLMLDTKTAGSAVSVINVNKIRDLASISIDARLQGQAAGVSVLGTSGQAGSGALMNIRGAATLNGGTDPLYIVDGIPVKVSRFPSLSKNVDNNPLADINPEDIASITILKDGQGTALYGMRGANGVIIINTYGGTSGKTFLDFSATMGVMQAPDKFDVFDANEYKDYIVEMEKARGLSDAQIAQGVGKYLLISTPADQVERYNNNTDWQDQVYRNGMYNDYHMKLRGGDAVAKYALMVGYTKQTGAVNNTDFDRFNTRFNLDYKMGKKLSFLNTISYTRATKSVMDEGPVNTNPIVLSTLKDPMLASFAQTADGKNLRQLDSADFSGRNNPYGVINGMTNEAISNRILGRITAQYEFSPNLNLRIAVGGDYYRLDESRFRPAEGFAPEDEAIRLSGVAKSYELMVFNENTLNFNRSFKGGRQVLDASVGAAFQQNSQDSRSGVYINAASDLFSGISSGGSTGGSNPATDPNIDSIGSWSPTWKLLSFFGVAQYKIDEKYIFSASLRSDGSSRFTREKRFGYFPSVSAAWRLSKEDFMKNGKLFSDLKLRASYGISGNQEVGYYNSFNALVSSPYNRVSGIRIGILGNPDFQWESTQQVDLGLDAEFLQGHIGVTIDGYVRKTDHLYNIIKLPSISGFDSYAVSEGAVRNSGLELSVYTNVGSRDFKWQMQANATFNKNEITSLPEKLLPAVDYGFYQGVVKTGEQLGSFYGYKAEGIYARTADVDVQNGVGYGAFQGGDVKFQDLNNDGVINENDKTIIGNSNPDFWGGFTNVFSYKGFDLTVFLDFATGFDIYNAHRALMESMSTYDNQSTSIRSHWTSEGDVTSMPRIAYGDPSGNTRFSSRWIEDGSYLRFKAVTLGYNFPLTGAFKNVFKSARITVSGQNLYTFSKYSGPSPDVAFVSNPVLSSIGAGNLPPLRALLIGVKLGF